MCLARRHHGSSLKPFVHFPRMALRGERTAFVQTLRTHARSCSVEVCRDDSSRARVTKMMDGFRASAGAQPQKLAAEKVFKLYEATFDENGECCDKKEKCAT